MLWCCASGRKQDGSNLIGEAARDFLAGLIVFIIIFALAALDAGPAWPQTVSAAAHAGQRDRSLTPAQMRSGALLVRPAQAGASSYTEAEPIGTDVSITVDGPVARAVVTQSFRNAGDKIAEGIYVFPLPAGAVVDTLDMRIGARTVAGKIVARSRAREIHTHADTAQPPALAPSAARRNIFTSTVTSIPAGETVMVRFEYQQVLHRTETGYALRFPLIAAPRMARTPMALGVRYAMAREGDTAARQSTNRARTERIALRVRLQAGFPLGDIESVNHDARIERLGEDGALLRVGGGEAPANRDFLLTWSPRESSEPTVRLFRQQFGKSQYVLATVNPPRPEPATRQPREVIFAVDTSGSMAGGAILHMRKALKGAIARLDASDRFNIIAFDASYEMLFKTAVPADQKGKAIAVQFIDRLIASGATDLIRPLTAALRDERPDDTTRVRQVVLITDGSFKKAQKLFSEIAVLRGRSRLFLVGIGPAPNVKALRRAAEVGRGSYLHIASTQDMRAELDEFLKRLEHPAITDIKVEWPEGVRAESLPDPIPDVYAGAPLVLSARVESALKGKVTITSGFGGKPWRKEIDIATAAEGHGLARLWARRKIASLESHVYDGRQDGGDVSARIEQVAIEHQLVSRMTRLVAFEERSAGPAGELSPASENAPPGRPHGLVHNGVFDLARGTLEIQARGPRAYVALRDRPSPRMAVAPRSAEKPEPDAAAATAQEADKGVRIAQASIDPIPPDGRAERQEPFFTARMGVIAVMALIFATMSALTLGLWRQFGRLYTADEEDDGRGK